MRRCLVEHVARHDEQLIANARLGRDVVAEDVDAVDDRRRALVDLPAQIDRRHGIRSDLAALDDRRDASRRCSPRSRRRRGRGPSRRPTPSGRRRPCRRSAPAQYSLRDVAHRLASCAERVEARDLVAREHLRAVDLEARRSGTAGPSLHRQANQRLALLPVDDERVLHHLHVDVAVRRVQLRGSLRRGPR